MIYKRIGKDEDKVLKEACENNGIFLTAKGNNPEPAAYIGLKGRKKILGDKFCDNKC